ncbi:ATP synthase F0 subunit B [Candidatus Gottesmanbacteria bacterium RIFCSPHIGHO2_02_FULL_40_13]|uniref:ATP synthase subunit b n=1 Tax=Candidatus Gottesmanbacteria bacterium RIFCSPHIGHO2_02_FULL_40_13 TaxID=1798384 RepID=A0A1F6A5P7_9BACT|nr:MAG: ATP synthase F0 subunit B [Candidatus Gottesmanbacteria bacterium RIFCSPHIGHO2_02_FULL_40_13]
MDKIGVEPVALLTQIINFLLMVLILSKILYKPILKMLDERKKKIEEGLKYTEKMQLEMEKLEIKKTEVLDKAREEVKKIIEEGKKAGKSVEADIIKSAHEEAKHIIESGNKEIDSEKAKMLKALHRETVDVSVKMAEKILKDVLSQEDQRSIIDKKLKQIAGLVK